MFDVFLMVANFLDHGSGLAVAFCSELFGCSWIDCDDPLLMGRSKHLSV